MTDGLIVHQTLCAAACLGVADLLAAGEQPVDVLAATLRVHEDALYRTLRFLAGQGVFREIGPRTFANTALSEYLRTDVAGSVRAILVFRGSHYYFSPFADFLRTVENGLPAREKTLGLGGFDYLHRNPEAERVFDDAMSAISALWAPDLAAAYDFGAWGTLMDVGGGSGLLLATILKAHRTLRGVLADTPTVLDRAREKDFLTGEVAARLRLEPCDFFESVPPGCRAYLMKNVLHDWDDERARRILGNCRRVVPADGVLLLVEYALGEANRRSLGKMVDVVMLTVTGGKERTLDEHRDLLGAASFRLNRAIPVSREITLLECLPA